MNCLQVARVLQSYLDGETDEKTARRVAVHLNDCRRCGLEASVYQEIHSALARRTSPDRGAMERLHAFGVSLLSDPPTGDDDVDHDTTPPGSAS
ncbi:anti-sigma factor family protein [Streptomyces sp. NPDC048567]|uniref:anti-sigma factor family protein n=1 Tax=Streptomyces sp. NPDC048567 TaxID=3365570 RepID=UPI00371F498B